MTVPHIVHQAAGAPPMEGSESGVCRTCGSASTGLDFHAWVRDTFTDWDKITAATIICHACQFCFADRNELLTRKLAKEKPQRMRNYSHFVLKGEWIPLSKGDKRRMRELLLADPEVAVIATSGQKHIIFRAKPGWWQIEEQSARPFPSELTRLLDLVEALYNRGFAKAEIESGRYNQRRILDAGLGFWCDHENLIRPSRGTLPLDLALFLSQRDTEENPNAARHTASTAG